MRSQTKGAVYPRENNAGNDGGDSGGGGSDFGYLAVLIIKGEELCETKIMRYKQGQK